MRPWVTFALIAVSVSLTASRVQSQTLRFADDEMVLGASGNRKTVTYYRNGRQTEDFYPTTVFLYKPNNGYLLRYNGCHFRLRPLQESSINFRGIAYSGMNYSMHDPVNSSGNAAGVCTWTADGGEVFLGEHQGRILFAINKRTPYTRRESADIASDWTVMRGVLEPRRGADLYRPKPSLSVADMPDWLKLLILLYGVEALNNFIGSLEMSPSGAMK
jgi:hypothetical protein